MEKTLVVKWGVSRGRNTYGYTTCNLYVDGKKVAGCNGGGYDMQGTVIGDYIAHAFTDKLMNLKPEDMEEDHHWDGNKRVSDGRRLYGLTYHDPNYDPGKAVIGEDTTDRTLGTDATGKTVEQAEKDGESLGLERYQAFYSASSKVPTERHTVPMIDGACGLSSVTRIINAIGLRLIKIHSSKKEDIWTLTDRKED